MPARKCELICHSVSHHLQQLYTGFRMLKDQGSIELSQRIVADSKVDYRSDAQHLRDAGHAHLDAIVNDSLRLHFDMHDAVELATGTLDDCDFYFKRSLSRTWLDQVPPAQRRKVFPLGLNYRVHPDGPDILALRRNWALNKGLRRKASGIREALDAHNLLGYHPRLKDLQLAPDEDSPPTVLFLVATYDPYDDPTRSAEKAEERAKINDVRGECIRLLRKALGNRFLGGFTPSKFSQRHYPDLVVPDPRITAKRNYLRVMKNHAICVATTGLHGSIGWKLAEYVACSRAILTEPLVFEVPGGFAERRNYLQFASPQECVDMAMELMESKELRTSLMTSNAIYYQSHLRPDAIVRNALSTALNPA